MNESVQVMFAPWVNFYLITGTAAATLTGLQFIVQTLLTSAEVTAATGGDHEEGIAAFGSPTVVHLSLALIVSAVVCAPWPDERGVRISLGAIAIASLVYSVIVLIRTRTQKVYRPEASDWAWHVVLPAMAYAALLVGAIALDTQQAWPEFAVAAATLLLICIGIHNAWDTVTYLTLMALRADRPRSSAPEAPRPSGNPQRSARRRRR
jgi:hypothetical protein